MGNERTLIAALCAVLLAAPAAAESASDALTRIEAETLLLKARERQLEVQANILQRQNDIAMKQGQAGGLPQIASGPEPQVRAIEGVGRQMFATLDLGGGALLDVAVGDVLPSGMRVVSIGAAGVSVRNRAGTTVPLAMAPRVPAMAHTAAGAGQVLPPLPPFPPLQPSPQRGPAR